MHEKIYQEISEDKELYANKKKNALELLKLRSAHFFEKQKKVLKNNTTNDN
jgi:hypothetical protein